MLEVCLFRSGRSFDIVLRVCLTYVQPYFRYILEAILETFVICFWKCICITVIIAVGGLLWDWSGIAVELPWDCCCDGIAVVGLLWHWCGIPFKLLWDCCELAVGLLLDSCEVTCLLPFLLMLFFYFTDLCRGERSEAERVRSYQAGHLSVITTSRLGGTVGINVWDCIFIWEMHCLSYSTALEFSSFNRASRSHAKTGL